MYQIKLEQVSKNYETGNERMAALSNISFGVAKGEFLAITGPSGCGKSTLLHIIGGLLAPSEGRVLVEGQSLYEKNAVELALYRRRQAGIVYQFYNLVPELNARENLILPARMDHRNIDEAWVDEVLEILGMRERQKAFPHELSGGQQQKIAVGRALVNRPQLLLADEPTGNLDCAKRDELLELFLRLNEREGMTIILVTHDSFVANMAGRRLCMSDGKLLSTGQNPHFESAGGRQRSQSIHVSNQEGHFSGSCCRRESIDLRGQQENGASAFLRRGENGAAAGRGVAGR